MLVPNPTRWTLPFPGLSLNLGTSSNCDTIYWLFPLSSVFDPVPPQNHQRGSAEITLMSLIVFATNTI